jgi:hypothetical protein
VRLGIFEVETMNQEGHFHQRKKNKKNKPFLLLGLSAISMQCPVVCSILPSARARQNNLTTARGGAALPFI